MAHVCKPRVAIVYLSQADYIDRYWVVFAFLNVIESAISVTYWLPFYYVFKFVFVMWLGLPQFG